MAEDERTRRWQRLPRPATDSEPLHALRTCIAAIRRAPQDPEARRRLRALAAEHDAWDRLARLLADEARGAAGEPAEVAFYEELVDVHENLDQPLETIAAMEAVVRLEPDLTPHRDRLAWLYRKAGAWAKAAETFDEVARLATGDLARAALHAAGRLYREHGRREAAVAAYRAIVARRPSDGAAWRALDEVLTELGRWAEAAEVRGALASRVATGVEKAALLRAQARAYEQAGDAEAAAEVVARAASHAPADVSGLVDYATVLARGGQGREAADILRARIADALERGAAGDDVAALRARLAGILEDACGDRPAAAAVLARLLADAPAYLPALERNAWHASHDPDPRVHAAALLRHAEALPAGPEQAAAVLEAARRLRDAHDGRAAVRAFETATELLPDDDDVRHELDDARTQLAVETAAAGAEAGDVAGAERVLRTLLRSHPTHAAANLALAELLAGSGRLADACEHLRATLAAAPEQTPPAPLAPLVHRYALLVAAQGDADEAHQLLHEAHRLDRRALPIKLALGESCFQRRLWREAALHLGSLAEHSDAPAHAIAVAAGLVHAAMAETRALRPANAERRYEAAVKLDPACAPAWHALGELASERGDLERAALCLEREAHATSAPRERLRLFDALGDLAAGVLGDPARAESCWAQVADAGSASVLGKLLAAQRARGATLERAATCERLAELAPAQAKPLLAEAATAYADGADFARARGVAERLVAAHPLDVDAIDAATAVMWAALDFKRTAAWLRRALGAWDAAADRGAGDPRRAELWRRLGDAQRGLGETTAALVAYERAVATAPRSDGALASRRGLVELSASTGREEQSSLIALVEADQQPADVLAWARELARGQRTDDACAAYELARVLSARLTSDDGVYAARHAGRTMASDEAYGAPLGEAERRALVDDPADGALGELLELLGEAAALVSPDAKTALSQADLADAQRVSAGSAGAAAAMYPQIGNALRGPQTLLYITSHATRDELQLLLAMPPVLVLGPRLGALRARSHADAELRSDAELRFALGRMVELARPHRLVATRGTATPLGELVAGLVLAFGPPAPAAGPPPPRQVEQTAQRLHAALPVALRRRLGERLATLSIEGLDASAYREACTRAADRAGLLACGRADLAIELAGGPAVARHLVQLAASEGYLAARRKLRARRADPRSRRR